MSGWVAVTFYTTGTGYEKEVRDLINSAHALEVPLEVYAYPPKGSWRENLNYKSECVLRAFEDFAGADIVFVDADAEFRAYPALFDWLSDEGKHDIAAHYLRHSNGWEELLSGTVWFKNPNARSLVRKWDEMGRRNPGLRHQQCLGRAIAAEKPAIYRLPFEYVCIFDHPQRRGKVPVIEHFQASRRYRRRLAPRPWRRRPTGPITSAGLKVAR